MTNTAHHDEFGPPVGIPAMTLGWRLQMAMDHGNRSREYMARACGVAPATISRWMHDQGIRKPRRGDLEIWARECRVPIEWLMQDFPLRSDEATGRSASASLRLIKDGSDIGQEKPRKLYAPLVAVPSK